MFQLKRKIDSEQLLSVRFFLNWISIDSVDFDLFFSQRQQVCCRKGMIIKWPYYIVAFVLLSHSPDWAINCFSEIAVKLTEKIMFIQQWQVDIA